MVEALSTNLFSVMQCDVFALLLPDSESGELRVTILYNPDARGPMREGSLVPMNSSISGQVLRNGKTSGSIASKRSARILKFMGILTAGVLYERVMAEGLKSGCYLPLHRPKRRGWRSDALQAFGQ